MRPPIFKLFLVKLEHKIIRESLNIALHLFIYSPGFYAIQLSQIPVKHYLLASDNPNHQLYVNNLW